MRYLRAGSGPALLLLHGLLGYSFSWRLNLAQLARKATVYAVDMLGAGFSDQPKHLDGSLRGHASALLRFLNEVSVSSFDLLGTSHGGAVAMMLASMCSQSPAPELRRLILVAPVNPWSAHGRWLAPLLGTPLGAFAVKSRWARSRSSRQFWLNRLYGDVNRISLGTLEGYSAPYQSATALDPGLAICRNWAADLRDLRAILPQIAGYPCLLLWGSRDIAVDPVSAESLRDVFHQCELRIMQGVGHLPYEESPSQFNRDVLRFLSQDRSG